MQNAHASFGEARVTPLAQDSPQINIHGNLSRQASREREGEAFAFVMCVGGGGLFVPVRVSLSLYQPPL